MTDSSAGFHPLQQVKVCDHDTLGYVTAKRQNCVGMEYRVTYFHNGKRADGWFSENDLEAAP